MYDSIVEDMRIVDLPGWMYRQQAAQNVGDKRFKIFDCLFELFVTGAAARNNIVAFVVDALHEIKERDVFNALIAPTVEKRGADCHAIGIAAGLGHI